MLVVIDYGMGNLRSVQKGFETIGHQRKDKMTKITKAQAYRAQGLRARVVDAMAAAVTPFPPDPGDWRPFGVDLSHFNGSVDFDKLQAYDNPKVEFVILRSGQGHPTTGAVEGFYTDTQFKANVIKATERGLPWMQYHVFMPNYPDTLSQVNWARQLQEETGQTPLALWCITN